MKNTNTLKLCSGLLFTAAVGSASATTVLIDFGRTDAVAASPYNAAAIIATGPNGTTGALPLTDTGGFATGWTVTVTDVGSGNAGNAGAGADVPSFPVGLAGYDATALRDSIYSNQGAGTSPAMTLLFAGLSPSATYDLILYGSRTNAQGADQRWSLTAGSGGAAVDHFSELNDTTYVDWTGISPDAGGLIEVTINSPGPDTIGALALNFGSITESVIPEPSSVGLLAIGLGLFARRRRR